ncbi:MAG: BON domain-containing protein [Myxococcota bacterium]
MFHKSQSLTPLWFAGGVIAGAYFMYMLDPRLGRRRRAITRDRLFHAARSTANAARIAGKDAVNRTRGVFAESRAALHPQPVPDDVLEARVRSKLGRACSHPHAVQVTARDGCVELRGDILGSELKNALRAVEGVQGICTIDNRLRLHNRADIPSLQGGHHRTGERFELLQNHWSPATRFGMGLAATAMLLHGVKQRGALAVPESVLGAGILARTLADHR